MAGTIDNSNITKNQYISALAFTVELLSKVKTETGYQEVFV